jgi:outer membrane protein OmpA-like peptidoglycan-associated protein
MATNTKNSKRSSVRVAHSRQAVSRRRGVVVRQSRRGRAGVKKAGLIAGGIVLALVIAGLALFSAAGRQIKECCNPLAPIASVVFDGASANSESVPPTGVLGDEFRHAADENRSIRLVGIDGAGNVVSNEQFDMTPKLDNGTVLKVAGRAEQATVANLDKVEQKINDANTAVPGQAVFLGLERLQLNTSAPIYVVSSLLDTSDPLDMRRLGWDVAPKKVVAGLKKSAELPDLTGADITFVVRPVAGDQEQLRQPQVEYREVLWRELALASGAAKVRFVYVDGTAPSSTVAGPVVPIPPPPTTPVPVNPKSGTCTVDTSAYFASDSDRLLDRAGTKAALRECVAEIGTNASVEVVGYTAGSDPDSKFAQALSKRRARAIAELLESLGVPSSHIEAVGMGNRNQPYPDPYDARNRSVVVSITN